jgi:2'-5' RNA ligase
MNLRLFIAIGIPVHTKREIGELLDILKKFDADVKWIPPENIHLTLKFLGSASENLLTDIRKALLPIISSYEPFYITIQSTGVFPNEKYPRVLWIGIVDSDLLKSLRDRIERSLALLGFQRDDKDFHPHLTLGRVRDKKGMIPLMQEFRQFRDRRFGDFLVDRVELMKSDLKPSGAEYASLYSMPLGKKEA